MKSFFLNLLQLQLFWGFCKFFQGQNDKKINFKPQQIPSLLPQNVMILQGPGRKLWGPIWPPGRQLITTAPTQTKYGCFDFFGLKFSLWRNKNDNDRNVLKQVLSVKYKNDQIGEVWTDAGVYLQFYILNNLLTLDYQTHPLTWAIGISSNQ